MKNTISRNSFLLTICFFMGAAVAGPLNSKELSRVLMQTAEKIREQTPIQLDEITTAMTAVATDKDLIYHYKFSLSTNQISTGFEQTQKEILKKNWCSAMPTLLSSGAIITGVYVDKNGVFIAKISITRHDCNY